MAIIHHKMGDARRPRRGSSDVGVRSGIRFLGRKGITLAMVRGRGSGAPGDIPHTVQIWPPSTTFEPQCKQVTEDRPPPVCY